MANNDIVQQALAKIAADKSAAEVPISSDEVPVAVDEVPAAPNEAELAGEELPEDKVPVAAGIPAVQAQQPALPTLPIETSPYAAQTIPTLADQAPSVVQAQAPVGVAAPQLLPTQPAFDLSQLVKLPEAKVQPRIEPSPEEVAQKVDEALAPEREAKAQMKAAAAVQAKKIDDARKDDEVNTKATTEVQKLDDQVRVKSLNQIMQSGTTAEKFSTIFAVMLGGISQGLTGAKENPAIAMLDRMTEQQAQRDKLKLEEKEMLRKQVYEQAQLKLQQLEQQTNSEYRRNQIALQRAELEAKGNEINSKLLADAKQREMQQGKFSGKALTPEQQATLTMEERRNSVSLPDGRIVLAQSYEDANKFKEAATEINNALSSIEELRKIAKEGSKFSLKDRARANSLITKIVGGLRLPYTGPGVLTDSEREMLIKTLGNPLALLSFRSVEMAKLDQVKDDLRANLQNNAKLRGIRESVVPEKFYNLNGKAVKETDLINAYRQRMPNLSADKIKAAIEKTVPEL
jgi:hypothetical protein